MYLRTSDAARNAFAVANRAAQESRHEYIDSAHILLGLLDESSGMTEILKDAHVDPEAVRFIAKDMLKCAPKNPGSYDAKKVVEAATLEARRLEHDIIDTAHILLGILALPDCLAASAFDRLCSDTGPLRQAALRRVADLPKVVRLPWEQFKNHEAIKPLVDRLEHLQQLKETEVANCNFETAVRLRDEGDRVKEEIHESLRRIAEDPDSGKSTD